MDYLPKVSNYFYKFTTLKDIAHIKDFILQPLFNKLSYRDYYKEKIWYYLQALAQVCISIFNHLYCDHS